MRFNSRNQNLGEIPEVDITPMLNVVMVVLAFFVIISTTLSTPPSDLPISLPPPSEGNEESVPPADGEPPVALRVRIEVGDQLTVDGNPVERAALLAELPVFLQNNPESPVFLIPGAEVDYQSVLQLLVDLQKVGGDRVSLAVGTTQDIPENTDSVPNP